MEENKIALPRLMTQQNLADYLRKSIAWCERSRWDGTGPIFLKLGRNVRYRAEDVQNWLNERERTSTQKEG